MRFHTVFAAATLLGLPLAAFAQTTPAPVAPAPSAPAPAAAAPATMTPPAAATAPMAPADTGTPAPKVKHSKRMTLQQHFDEANTTHDGHLTRDQADADKWRYVSRHFDVMDADHKGYVTVDDIHAYAHTAHTKRAARSATPQATGDTLPHKLTPGATSNQGTN